MAIAGGGSSRAKRRKHVLLIVALAVFMLAIGLVAGFFIAKSVGTYMLTHCHAANSIPPATLSTAPDGTLIGRDASAAGFRPEASKAVLVRFRELPEPGTEEAAALRAAPDTGAMALESYKWFEDAILITEELTAAFLMRLEQQLADSSSLTKQQQQPATVISRDDLSAIISTFVALARDVLRYLRHRNSIALLPLLRQFSVEGSVTVTDMNPDDLQREINELLNLTAMGSWYSQVSSRDKDNFPTEPVPLPLTAAAATSQPQQQDSAGSPAGSTTGPGGRRLLSSHAWHHQHIQPQFHHVQRRLQAAYTIPTISPQTAAQDVVIPTVSPPVALEDMLCSIKSFSPTGLDGMYLPTATNTTQQPIKCPPPPRLGLFHHGNVVFKPVVIPVVFHCQRFKEGDVLQPPMWKAEEGAANLIEVANLKYKGTGIQFKLQEVRYDVENFPYLLLASLNDWQICSGNPDEEALSFPCLRETARFPEVATLAEKHVINVLVGGSQTSMFCNDTTSVCNKLYLGYTGSIGPWFANPSSTWREGVSEENWVTITWDMFSVYVANSERFWNAGAATLAHEFGHYLGLMHTHQGTAPCEGDGFSKADSVPDTPTNRPIGTWAEENGLGVELPRWCTEFRTGKRPQPKKLLVFNSCGHNKTRPGNVDNVFNLMSNLPDPCMLVWSPNQVARMQWATATFRQKMMARYYV